MPRNLNNIAGDGVSAVKTLIESIQDIQMKSGNIMELLNLIREISDNTKLLALNASIEAAYAGGNGKGFYIVAKEIRKLAEDAEKSIKRIEGVINTLIVKINESVALSGKTEFGLGKIVENVSMNTEMSDQLNFLMLEQDRGVNEILKATHELLNITTEIKDAMSRQVKATEEFKTAMFNLSRKQINIFKRGLNMKEKINLLIQVLKNTPEIIENYFLIIPVKDLEVKRGDNFWTVKEHLLHLEYVQDILYDRILKFKNEAEPKIVPYFPDNDKTDKKKFDSIEEIFDSFKNKRNKQIMLINQLTAADIKKTAVHVEYKKYNLEIILNHIVFHDYWHMYRIEELWLTKDEFLSG